MPRPDNSSFVEPCVIQTSFADGLATVEVDKNGNARVVFYAEQRDVMSGGMERHVVARLIIPQDGMVSAAERMLAAAASAGPSFARAETLRGMN